MLSDETRQTIEVIATMLGSGGAAWIARHKGRKAEEAKGGQPTVVAASVISDHGIERLAESLRDTTDRRIDSDHRTQDRMDSLRDQMGDLQRAIERVLPDGRADQQIAELIARMNKIEGTRT